MEIIRCSQEVIDHVPKIIDILGNVFGSNCQSIRLFAVDDDDNLGFIARDSNNCVYINNKGEYTLFSVDEDNQLARVYIDSYVVTLGVEPIIHDDKGIEYMVQLIPIEPDEDEYTGYVSYKQYNSKTDVLCDIHFQHMYREIDGVARIYPYHTEQIDSIYIDEDCEKYGVVNKGKLPKRCKYYGRIKFDSEELGYKMMAINDFGIKEFLNQGAICLLRESPAIRYIRLETLKSNGDYVDYWPFAKQLKEKDIDAIIESYGFSKKIPALLLDLHNKQEPRIKFIEQLVEEMNRVERIYEQPEYTDMCMQLKLIPDK